MQADQKVKLKQEILSKVRRIVIKVGSAVLTNEYGINKGFVADIAREISLLRKEGKEVIVVSSGAVAAGRKKIKVQQTTLSMKEKQALAAIGQSSLMRTYEEAFHFYELSAAQVLLTHDDLSHRDRYLNVRNTIFTLLEFGVTPIVNENDTVSVEELRFGDNDNLAALLTNLLEADLFICLTDVDALYDKNPQQDHTAKPLHIVYEINDEIEAMASNSNSLLGTGGMQSKIKAAKIVHAGGGSSIIGAGRTDRVLEKLLTGKNFGTFFLPCEERMKSRKQWIAHVLKPKGKIVLDEGACYALSKRGKSLLPSGIKAIEGTFCRGDAVELVNSEKVRIGVGLVNYKKDDVEKVKGRHTDEMESQLEYFDSIEVIHRDNMVIMK